VRTYTGMVLAAALAGGVVAAGALPAAAASSGIIATVAGGPGLGAGTNVSQLPTGVAAAPDGSVYVADLGGVVRALNDGTGYEAVTAGVGVTGYSGDHHYAGRAQPSEVQGVAAGPDGSVPISDFGNDRVRVVATSTGSFYGQAMTAGDIYAVAGTGHVGYSGDGGPPPVPSSPRPAIATDPRVDASIDALPGWQHAICPRTVAVRQGETINAPALTAMFRQIIANNRAGGRRKLKNG
jgi:hypothetical protein